MLIGTSRLRIKAQTPARRLNLILLKSATSRQVAGRSQPAGGVKTMMRIAQGRGDFYRLGILAGVTLGDLDADGWVGPAQLH